MNQIKGKKYYISIGYIDPDEHFDAKFIENVIVAHKDGRVYHDEENDIKIPIMPISQIQKKDNKFIFKYLFFPFRAICLKRKDELIRYNTFGLFEVTTEQDIENIRLVQFYETSVQYGTTKANTIIIEVDEEKLMEEKQNG